MFYLDKQSKSIRLNDKMAQNGGKRQGAGRKPGIPNKRRKALDELIDDKDVELCMKTIKEAIKNTTNAKLKLDAAFYLLDQKFGKARQRNEITGSEGKEFVLEIRDYRGTD